MIMTRWCIPAAFILCLGGIFIPLPAFANPESCVDCHKDEKFRVQNKKIYDYYQEWKGSSHEKAKLSCTACHGGDASQTAIGDAHKGILPQSDPRSPFNYKNIPKTCGGCHPDILERFQKSRHYEQITTKGTGPTCITCHGSLNTKVYSVSIVDRSCANCHTDRNRPEIIAQAREILERLNHANGYRNGLRIYYTSINKPGTMKNVDKAYEDVIHFLHEFDFKRLGPRSQDLWVEVKALFDAARENEKKDKKK